MFQRILAFISIIICIAIIIIGYLHWNEKISNTTNHSADTIRHNATISNHDNQNNIEQEGNEEEAISKVGSKYTYDELKQLVAELPEEISKVIKDAYINEKQAKIVLVGSSSMGSEEDGWGWMVKEQLEEFYGEDSVQVLVFNFEGTSSLFIEDELAFEIAEEKADIVLLEGFTLEDNLEIVPLDKSHSNIEEFIGQVHSENPNSHVILQPPNPIYNAVNYPKQVVELQVFAEEQNLPYLNHWENWPDPTSTEIKDFLDDDSRPNEAGHELWAKVVVEYFGG